MHKPFRFVPVITFTALSISFAFGQQVPTVESPETPAPVPASAPAASTWGADLWNWPVLHFFVSIFGFHPAEQPAPATEESPTAGLPEPVAACSVASLDPITDPAAQQLEASSGLGSAVDVDGMVPAAARALNAFQSKVEAVGGSMVLKSAYRPAAYQQHLQNVWYKWMDELRNNHDPACQDLQAQVQEEFVGHHLIETQHPVAVSDHTRGLAFDATVTLPAHAHLGRRRFSLDSLARIAGLLRPAIAADPVHFKFVGALKQIGRRTARVASARRSRHSADRA